MFSRLFLLLSLLSVSFLSSADIGETFDMQAKREQLVKENEVLLSGRHIDSLNQAENSRYVENLHIIALIDADIFKSQQETIDRLGGTAGKDQHINKTIALLCFIMAVILLTCFYMLYLMNQKLNRYTSEEKTFSGRVNELFSVVLTTFQPVPEGRKGVAINKLIVFGMLFMFFSVLGYLLKTLGV